MDIFGANSESKIENKKLYWQWKLETGVSQDEIDANDVLDSKWIDGEILLEIEATGRQVTDDSVKQYDVTFDLNGGSLANYDGAGKVTKKVSYGDVYGELPVPTRKGYRFVGWNGSNLFSIKTNQKTKARNVDIEVIDKKYIINNKPIETIYQQFAIDLLDFNVKANYSRYLPYDEVVVNKLQAGDYIISIEKMSENIPTEWCSINIFTNVNNPDEKKQLAEIDLSKNKTQAEFSLQKDTDVYISLNFVEKNQNFENVQFYIQLQEKNFNQPFFINKDMLIKENKNHTLTAIWEKTK